VAQSTTFQKPFSKDGSHIVLPSGEIDIRSQPPSKGFSQMIFIVARSIRCSDSIVLIKILLSGILTATPLTLEAVLSG
jgi:hypothetical protein